jgi:hypothetical protein
MPHALCYKFFALHRAPYALRLEPETDPNLPDEGLYVHFSWISATLFPITGQSGLVLACKNSRKQT